MHELLFVSLALYCSILLHCVDLACGILYSSTCNYGWCFLFCLIQILKCFDLTDHLQEYNVISKSVRQEGLPARQLKKNPSAVAATLKDLQTTLYT
jgi:hypothetical protein